MTIESVLDAHKVNHGAGMLRRYFLWLGVLVVVGVLLIGEEPIFGTPGSVPKILMGVVLCSVGVGYSLYLIYWKRQMST